MEKDYGNDDEGNLMAIWLEWFQKLISLNGILTPFRRWYAIVWRHIRLFLTILMNSKIYLEITMSLESLYVV